MKTRLLIPVVALAWLAPAQAFEIRERADLDPNGSVEISNVAGKVIVRGWDRNEVELTGTLWDGAKELVFDADGRRVYIEVRHERNTRNIRGSTLIVSMPATAELDVTAVSADIETDDVTGPQALQSVSGDVTATAGPGSIEARTVSGDVAVTGNGRLPRATLVTVSGEITGTGLSGDIEVNAVSGDIQVAGRGITRLRGSTVSGDIELDIGLADGARADIEAINGDIEIVLANETDIEFDIESFNGDIDEVFGVKARRKSKYGPGRELRTTLGNASRRLRVETLNGDIEIDSSRR